MQCRGDPLYRFFTNTLYAGLNARHAPEIYVCGLR